ncbi:hypothetical protein IEQ34_021185 [Dendrobium chrysotoxum]|uniref:Uncharacterized protein n=1 Tax=Dendrobium chrysotoxum TaxID=161865 RepID=A0AAV7G484_DENCH|nr:hypothetical protein IEQ34_021185 [Dendrobium chrysotoxum]
MSNTGIKSYHPISFFVPVTGNADASNPGNANVTYDRNATGALEILANVPNVIHVLPINVVMVNEDNYFQTINDVDVDTANVSFTNRGIAPSTDALPLVLSCDIREGVNVVLGPKPCFVNLIASLSPSSNVGGGDDVAVDSDYVPLGMEVGDAVSPYENEVVQGDWLADCDSTSNWDAGEEIDVQRVNSRKIYDLNVIQIVEDGYFKKVGFLVVFLVVWVFWAYVGCWFLFLISSCGVVGLFVCLPVCGFAFTCCFWPRLVLLLVFLFFPLFIDCNSYDPFALRRPQRMAAPAVSFVALQPSFSSAAPRFLPFLAVIRTGAPVAPFGLLSLNRNFQVRRNLSTGASSRPPPSQPSSEKDKNFFSGKRLCLSIILVPGVRYNWLFRGLFGWFAVGFCPVSCAELLWLLLETFGIPFPLFSLVYLECLFGSFFWLVPWSSALVAGLPLRFLPRWLFRGLFGWFAVGFCPVSCAEILKKYATKIQELDALPPSPRIKSKDNSSGDEFFKYVFMEWLVSLSLPLCLLGFSLPSRFWWLFALPMAAGWFPLAASSVSPLTSSVLVVLLLFPCGLLDILCLLPWLLVCPFVSFPSGWFRGLFGWFAVGFCPISCAELLWLLLETFGIPFPLFSLVYLEVLWLLGFLSLGYIFGVFCKEKESVKNVIFGNCKPAGFLKKLASFVQLFSFPSRKACELLLLSSRLLTPSSLRKCPPHLYPSSKSKWNASLGFLFHKFVCVKVYEMPLLSTLLTIALTKVEFDIDNGLNNGHSLT